MESQIVPSEGVPTLRSEAISVESLIAKAIDKSLPVETMERFLAMRTQLKAEFAREEFYRCMAEFQAKCPVIEKRKKVYEKGTTEAMIKAGTAKIRYQYAPLDSIVEQTAKLMGECGLSHRIETVNDDKFITAICHVSHKLGYSESSSFRVPIDFGAYMSAQQQYAAALTYAKRYAFCDAFGIMTGDEDTDANTITPEEQTKQFTKETFPNHTKAASVTYDRAADVKKGNPPPAREPMKFTPKAEPAKPAISENDAKKIKIMDLMTKNGLDPVAKTKDGWEKAIKSSMGLDLVTENFDKIIEILSKTAEGPPENTAPKTEEPKQKSLDEKLEGVFGSEANPSKDQDWREAARSCETSNDALDLIRAMEAANEKKGTISMIRGMLSTRGLIS